MTTRAAWTQSDEEDGATQLEGVTVIVPAYNEEGGIGPTLEELVKIMAASELQHEIVVIDDGSTDRTAEVAGQHAVRLVRHKTNAGYGDALKTGIRLARYPLIAITDADGTYPNDRLAELVDVVASQDADMAVGARTGPEVTIPLIRRPAKWLIGRLAELAAGRAIPDLNSGLRVFRRATAMRMLSILPSGFSFTTTITLAMLNNGYTVEYLPVNYYARTGRSKICPSEIPSTS